MMSKVEMTRRLATMTQAQLDRGHKMVLDGYGGHGMTLESDLTLKQANALHAWVGHYGRIVPTVVDGVASLLVEGSSS